MKGIDNMKRFEQLTRKERYAYICNSGFLNKSHGTEDAKIKYLFENSSVEKIKEWFENKAVTVGINDENLISVYMYNRIYEKLQTVEI